MLDLLSLKLIDSGSEGRGLLNRGLSLESLGLEVLGSGVNLELQLLYEVGLFPYVRLTLLKLLLVVLLDTLELLDIVLEELILGDLHLDLLVFGSKLLIKVYYDQS